MKAENFDFAELSRFYLLHFLILSLSFLKEQNIESFKLFEARFHGNMEYQMQCLKMFLNDLKDMLQGLKKKLFHRTFKKVTDWDESYLKYLRFTVETCSVKVEDALNEFKAEFDVRRYFQEYHSLGDSLMETLNNVK